MANLWLSKTLDFGEDASCHLNGTDVLHPDSYVDCEGSSGGGLYGDFFLVGVHVVTGQLMLMAAVERLQRRVTLSGC